MRPEVSSRTRDSFTWIRALRRCYPNDEFLIGGDFNAKHPQWGYDYHTPRGTALVDATETTDLVLANDTDYTTRAALHSGQRNTTLDLTLSTPDIVKDWRCDPDAWGSDHYPLWITLNMGRKCAAGRTVRTIRWDAYRRAFSVQPKTASVRERASHALRMATTETERKGSRPHCGFKGCGRCCPLQSRKPRTRRRAAAYKVCVLARAVRSSEQRERAPGAAAASNTLPSSASRSTFVVHPHFSDETTSKREPRSFPAPRLRYEAAGRAGKTGGPLFFDRPAAEGEGGRACSVPACLVSSGLLPSRPFSGSRGVAAAAAPTSSRTLIAGKEDSRARHLYDE
ncbi:hypothetical protein HPB49_019762 [Dermacentor silvarum]|uniref:Uncharacterized protein n=1 Tax=Dermacentor silvarum TaxID=543639 RepID=A0ACB8CZM6_DERSI|nr:hypothetical protein HPB49_019762 [Dermacentor silvarum]